MGNLIDGLLIPQDEARRDNLTIVVANDDGCGIFELLEQGAEPYRGTTAALGVIGSFYSKMA